jgi:hypothetical protein
MAPPLTACRASTWGLFYEMVASGPLHCLHAPMLTGSVISIWNAGHAAKRALEDLAAEKPFKWSRSSSGELAMACGAEHCAQVLWTVPWRMLNRAKVLSGTQPANKNI